jgi:translation initiation factor 2 beta subunit (eIF-2beta)/eIF-5
MTCIVCGSRTTRTISHQELTLRACSECIQAAPEWLVDDAD